MNGLMTDSCDDPTICFCHSVPRSKIIEAIRAGATTIEAIQDATCASTGCGGCEFDLMDILEEELSKMAADKKASGE
jgi:NAD(P)H-nitrite reductase large subunit